jgi:hypothetical protein
MLMYGIKIYETKNSWPSATPSPQGSPQFLVRSICKATSLSMFASHLSANPRSVKRSADLRALRLMSKVSCGDSVSALRKPSAYWSTVVAWKPAYISYV